METSSEPRRTSSDTWDYVMVFTLEKRQFMEQIKKRLIESHLTVLEEYSIDGDEIFLYITITDDVLMKVAEEREFKKQLKDEFGGGFVTFKSDLAHEFRLCPFSNKLFTSYERSKIIHYLFGAPRKRGGCNFDIFTLVEQGKLLKCFCLHEDKENKYLRDKCLDWKHPRISPLEINDLKHYFGSYISIYYAWLAHYTWWLIPPAVVGAFFMILGIWSNINVPMYSIFIILWATFYLEFWKRRNSELITLWDVQATHSDRDRIRPTFQGVLRSGVYVDGEFVPLDNEVNLQIQPKVRYSPSSKRYMKMTGGVSILCTFLAMVVIGTLSIFLFRTFIDKKIGSTFGNPLAGIMNAITIMVFNMIYRKVAIYLTKWENHRTEENFENSFIVKNFMFQFVNSYISLFYIAFVKGRFNLFGVDKEECKPDCMSELRTQLTSIFLTMIFVQQSIEVLIPWIFAKLQVKMEQRKTDAKTPLLGGENEKKKSSKAEQEAKLWAYASTYDDYNEMAIQFGYVTLFAAAFPLAPLAAFLNNLVELRSDMLKLLSSMQRPHSKIAIGIGYWYDILEIISYISVLTNMGLIVFTDNYLKQFSDINEADKVWILLIFEHAVFILKFVIARLIPDTPGWVRKLNAKRIFLRELAIEGTSSYLPVGGIEDDEAEKDVLMEKL